MSLAEDNKALMYRWFEEVWNQRKVETIDEILSPDVVAHGLTDDGSPSVGWEGFKEAYRLFTGAFPDMTITIDEIVADDEVAAVRFTCRGTHKGDTLGVAASQRPIKMVGMTMARILDGKIVGGWNIVDFLTMQRQIGLLPTD